MQLQEVRETQDMQQAMLVVRALRKYESEDGMPLSGHGMPGIASLFASTLISHMNPSLQEAKDKSVFSNTPSFMVITGENDLKETWIKVGQVFERIALFCAAKGLATAPYAGIVEQKELNKELKQILGGKRKPIFFSRIGYPTKPSTHSPRRSLEGIVTAL